VIRRSLLVGLIAGFLISLAGLYPLLSLFAPVALPGWQRPIQNEVAHGLLLMASAAVGVPTILGLGAVAVRLAGVRGWLDGAKAGMIAGLVAGLFCFITLGSPLNALLAYGQLTPHISALPDEPLPPIPALQAYVNIFDSSASWVEMALLVSVLVGGAQGAIAGWRRRGTAVPEQPTLLEWVEQGRHPGHWLAGSQSAARVGLTVGSLIGALGLLTTFSWFYVAFAQDWPELGQVMQSSHLGVMITGPLRQALPILSPLIIASLLGFGALVVALIRNPPNRFAARIGAVILAATTIAGFFFAVGQRILYFNLGLLPFWVARSAQTTPDAETDATLRLFIESANNMTVPVALVIIVMALPWVIALLVALAGLSVGGLQGVVFASLLAWLNPRPVDKAAVLQRRLAQKPADAISLLVGLFRRHTDAYDVLAHIAALTYKPMPAVARLAAAYHTLGQSGQTEAQTQALAAIQATLAEQPEWRWSADFGAVYRALYEVLTARTLEQILLVRPLPEQQTSSLPPLMVKSVQHIGRIVNELHKVNKVEDMGAKLIFLENSLAAIHETQRFVDSELSNPAYTKTAVPEQAALASALDHWQTMALATIKRLKGRAYVVSELQSKCCAHTAAMPLMLQVANSGLNVAQQVRLRLLPGEDYFPGEEEAHIEILPPGEAQQVMVSVKPRDGATRLRVAWEIRYDDAVDADRQVQFADVVEFAEPERPSGERRPFARIFPIPYVTGTPLKTDDVFVGREDVFAFIRENLLGAHQNNVIILHGQRRTGKTSVLYRLGQMMADTHVGVLVDMQGKPARGEADFLFSIADDIIFTLEDHGIEVEPQQRADFADAPEFFFRARFLRGLYPRLNGKNLLLMFDEFEELQRRVEDGRLQPDIFPFLRNLMQHEDRVDFIFSGTHKLEDLGAAYWSVLFNIAVYKPITFLSSAEIQRLIQEPVAGYDVEYDPLAVARISQVTAGHPYFTQLVLHEMIVYHNEIERSYLTVADVNQVLERIVERGEAHFKYIWAESLPEERLVLQGCTELMGGGKPAHVDDVRAFLGQRGYESADKWAQALASLESRDILTRPSARSPLYRFKVDLIRLWIERSRPAL
jgi:hypothetical protein